MTDEDQQEWGLAVENLSGVLSDQGRLDEAWALQTEVLRLTRRLRGPTHLVTARALADLGTLANRRSDPETAARLIRQAQAILDTRLAPLHPDALSNLNNLAVALQKADRMDEAERVYRTVLERRRRRYGPEHAEVASSIQNLATLLSQTGRQREAAPLYREALRMYRATLPPTHHLPGFVLLSMAEDALDAGRYHEAEAASREARPILLANLPPEHMAIAIADTRIGRAIVGQGRAADAEPYLVRAYENLTARDLAEEDNFTRQARDALVAVYRATGRRAQADALRAEGPPAE